MAHAMHGVTAGGKHSVHAPKLSSTGRCIYYACLSCRQHGRYVNDMQAVCKTHRVKKKIFCCFGDWQDKNSLGVQGGDILPETARLRRERKRISYQTQCQPALPERRSQRRMLLSTSSTVKVVADKNLFFPISKFIWARARRFCNNFWNFFLKSSVLSALLWFQSDFVTESSANLQIKMHTWRWWWFIGAN